MKLSKKNDEIAEELISYKDIFYELLDYLMLVDGHTGKILEINKIWSITTGFTREEIISKHFSQVFDDEQIVNSQELEKIITHDTVVSTRLLKRKDGEPIPVEMSITMVSFRGKDTILTILRNIKERIEAEEKITLMNKRLEELNSTKDKFFSIIAHDLRNQFNVLMSFSELLLKDSEVMTEKDRHYFLSQIENVSRSTYGLLSNLLNWARSQTGKLKVQKDVIVLNDVISTVLKEVEGLLTAKELKVIFNREKFVIVYSDEDLLKTVIRNLLSNCIKFSFKGSELLIDIVEKDNLATVEVKDFGTGMDEKQAEEIFEIGGNSKRGTLNEEGTGLGLPLCKEFIEKLGGVIWCKSAPGVGTSMFFTVELPQ